MAAWPSLNNGAGALRANANVAALEMLSFSPYACSDAEGVLLIEWPERLPALWPEALQLRLQPAPAGGRALTALVPEAWGGRWPPR